jgi:hypothetical protein
MHPRPGRTANKLCTFRNISRLEEFLHALPARTPSREIILILLGL